MTRRKFFLRKLVSLPPVLFHRRGNHSEKVPGEIQILVSVDKGVFEETQNAPDSLEVHPLEKQVLPSGAHNKVLNKSVVQVQEGPHLLLEDEPYSNAVKNHVRVFALETKDVQI